MDYDHTLRCFLMPPGMPHPPGWYWVILDSKRQTICGPQGPFATMATAQADAQLETGGAVNPDVKTWKPFILKAF